MDITFSESDIIEQNEDILIHLFFHILDFDYRNGFFSDDSSIHDMGTCGFTQQDYIELAKLYNKTCPENYTYSQGQKYYLKLSNERFDNMVIEKFEKTYDIAIDNSLHYLKDFIILLKENFPNRNWATENIFILRTLDNRLKNEEDEILNEFQKLPEKVIKFPVKKKLSQEEIRTGLNTYLMVEELGMSLQEARQLANTNYEKKYEGKKYQPYIPK